MSILDLSRRECLGALMALGACTANKANSSESLLLSVPPLREACPVPIGCAVMNAQLQDPATVALLLRNFSQITAEAEMKMGAILAPDGHLRFGGADAITAFATQNRIRLHGHTLIWHKYEPEAFRQLDGNKPAFSAKYDDYIRTVVSRYRGQIPSWDVVNEAVNSDGLGLRATLWGRNFGDLGYIDRAFRVAREADPAAKLFINEYDLERKPEKRLAFMRMLETLLKQGVPIDGIGTQTHINIDIPPGAVEAAFKDIASLGLPIHISELDISFGRNRFDWRSLETRRSLQMDQMERLVHAFMALPERQRYAFTLWGLRDSDSWLRKDPINPVPDDEPLAFDAQGLAKPLAAKMVRAFDTAKTATHSKR